MGLSFLNTINLSKKQIGDRGEDLAAKFLIKNKYKILERNHRVKHGEIDIIAFKKDKILGRVLCFVEVKTRKFDDGSAERATGRAKLGHIFYGAKAYCLQNYIDFESIPMSFEQISVYTNNSEVRHYILPVE